MSDVSNLVETFKDTINSMHTANPTWETNLVLCKVEEMLSHLMSGKDQAEKYLQDLKNDLY